MKKIFIFLLFSVVWTGIPAQNSCPSSVKDIDGNVYSTVEIGSQCWMRENLRVTHFDDGIAIAQGDERTYDKACYYYPDGYSANVSTYGLLYNWTAVMHEGKSASYNSERVQGICPKGWHVPSDEEWKQLELAAGMSSEEVEKINSRSWRGRIAVKLSENTGWESSDEDNAGSREAKNRNSTGFSALPAGGFYGFFYDFSFGAYFWTSTEYDNEYAYRRGMHYDQAGVSRCGSNKCGGLSVRCLRN